MAAGILSKYLYSIEKIKALILHRFDRFRDVDMQLFHQKRLTYMRIAQNNYAPFTKNQREIVTIQKNVWGAI
jgi:hypothetical protein